MKVEMEKEINAVMKELILLNVMFIIKQIILIVHNGD